MARHRGCTIHAQPFDSETPMRTTPRLSHAALLVGLLGLAACSAVQNTGSPTTLVAVKTSSAPNMSAGAGDAIWAAARSISVPLTGGVNFGGKGETTATLKAAYTSDTLYMLVQYNDPTDSRRRGPYQKQADGSWKKLVDPADKGGDDNIYYEDKWAMIWPINNSIKNFENKGCAVMCHVGEGKPFGNKYTRSEGEIADMWHMKGQRTAPWGYVDDQYVDHTRYDAKTSPNAGRKSDPGGPEYSGFPLENGKPKFMHRDGKSTNAGGTHYIKAGDEVPFDDGRFKSGDEVASFLIHQLKGDRADLRVHDAWSNGVHTSVLSRKLVTGSKFDVQFDNLDARYLFGFAAFDNAQVQHATSDDPLTLVFQK
jgi:hypothetical protein